MSDTRSLELFEALQAAGFAPDDARKVTTLMVATDGEAVTKADLKAELAELESRLQKTILTAMLGMTAIFGTLVVALKLFG